MDAEKHLQQLIERTRLNLNEVEEFKKLSDQALNKRPRAEAWSILECVEHLNRYGAFYLPAIEQSLQKAKTDDLRSFRSGLLGGYFAKSMLPKEKLNKMKTFKEMNPIHSKLNQEVLQTFVHQQERMLTLLQEARKVDLTKTKTPISISRLLKFRLGDTFHFVINHNWRHLEQAKKNV
ncbi:MAG: DinB family protein [Crocinitomicaceae bacterium]|nr:DinB family protein [Crocinitomicaceae bacterium]